MTECETVADPVPFIVAESSPLADTNPDIVIPPDRVIVCVLDLRGDTVFDDN